MFDSPFVSFSECRSSIVEIAPGVNLPRPWLWVSAEPPFVLRQESLLPRAWSSCGPHRGALVSELSPDEITEVYLVRVILEGTAARLAAPKMDGERIATLGVLLQALEGTADPDEW